MVRPVKLIGAGESQVDDIGQIIEVETSTDVFADISSVSQSEFASAGQIGLKPSLVFHVWQHEYNNQKVVEYDGTRYAVYRTYNAPDGRVELYTEERTGENQNDD